MVRNLRFLLIGFVCSVSSFTFGQVIQSVGTAADANVKVFITDDAQDADLFVFRVDYKKDSKGNRGLWYFQDALTYADLKVYFTDSRATAELVIYFVEEREDAKWQNSKKKNLLE